MYLCIRFLAFLALILAKVSAHYHYAITFQAQDVEDENSRRTLHSVEFDFGYGVSSGWCAPEQTEPKNIPDTVTAVTHSGKTAPWYCTFYAMMNRTANCIISFHTAKKNSNFVINLNIEKNHIMFNIESNETETQINIKSPFTIDLGRCALNGRMENRYYADSTITLDRPGKWLCRFYIQRRPVNISINLRSSEHRRIYETIDGIEPILITQESEDQHEMNARLTMSDIQCANDLPIKRLNFNSSYISLNNSKGRGDTWECNFHNNTLNQFCIFKVRETPPPGYNMMRHPREFTGFAHCAPSMTMTHVLLSSIGVAVLVIIMLICVICFYKNKVNKFKENVTPPNIIGRAPFETPPEVVYDCVYSHPAGLKRPGIKTVKNTDQTQLIN